MSGDKPPMAAQGYSWKETHAFNKWIQEKHQNTNLENAKQLLNESSIEIQRIIADHTSEELFEKKRYKWTGATSPGVYLVSTTSSHYDWALKLTKKVKK